MGDGTVSWTRVTCAGTADFECIDDAVRDPSTPSTSGDYIETASNNANEWFTTTAPTNLQPDETNIWVEFHVYAATGPKRSIEMQVCDKEGGGGQDCSATTTIGSSETAAWFTSANMTIPCSFDESASNCQTVADDLTIHFKQKNTAGGGSGGFATIYAAYYILSYVREFKFSGMISETTTVSESLVIVSNRVTTISTPSTVSDTIFPIATRFLTEDISIADTASTFQILFRYMTETASITDSSQPVFTMTLTEAIAIADSFPYIKPLRGSISALRTIAETISITDTSERIFSSTRRLIESISVSDVLAKGSKGLTVLLSELVSVSERASTTSSEVFTTLIGEESVLVMVIVLSALVLGLVIPLVIWQLIRRERQKLGNS